MPAKRWTDKRITHHARKGKLHKRTPRNLPTRRPSFPTGSTWRAAPGTAGVHLLLRKPGPLSGLKIGTAEYGVFATSQLRKHKLQVRETCNGTFSLAPRAMRHRPDTATKQANQQVEKFSSKGQTLPEGSADSCLIC